MQAHLIEVTPTPTPTPTVVKWTLCYTAPNSARTCGGPPDYVPVDIPKGNADQLFVLNIKNPSNLGVKFAATVEDALWIQADDKPTVKVMEPKNQILQPTRVSDTILVFTDKNSGSKKLLKYRLNFVGTDGKAVTSLDPDIRNGGGGKVSSSSQAVALMAFTAGFALALLLTVVWFKKLSPNRNRPN